MSQRNPFKWRHFEAEIILLCVRWYLRYALSYRHLEEMMLERGLSVDHTTLYRWVQHYAPESEGNTIDFLLCAKRDARAAERFFRKALRAVHTTQPRVINADQNAAYPPVFEVLQQDGALSPSCTLRPIAYLNNIIEQDHRFVKRRARYCLGFGSFRTAWRVLRGFEVMHISPVPYVGR
jgi:IS6 family transposase